MSERPYLFLTATLGLEGSLALQKACERVPDLKTVMLPRAVLSWLHFMAPRGYQGAIPGTDAGLTFAKSEDSDDRFAGEVTWNGNTYCYQDASLYEIAAAVALAIGAKAKEVSDSLKTDELAALGKSVDVLVKAHAANEQLRKAELPGSTAKPKPPLAPASPEAPISPKVGGATLPKAPKPGGMPAVLPGGMPAPAARAVPKLPGMGKKPAPKLPSLKVGKSEMSALCAMCGQAQFEGVRFTGCTCLRALAKSVTSAEKPDGVLLTFGKSWDRENIESLMNLLRGED